MNDQVKQGFYGKVSTEEIITELEAHGYHPQLIDEEPGSYLQEHSHERSHIIILVDGAVSITLEGKRFDMKPGDLITIPSNHSHAAESGDSGCKYIWVEM